MLLPAVRGGEGTPLSGREGGSDREERPCCEVATEASLWVGVASVLLLWMVFSWKKFWLRILWAH